jgi:predicted alpha/beta-hydrolase family hydrolase
MMNLDPPDAGRPETNPPTNDVTPEIMRALVATPVGQARLTPFPARRRRATLVLGHGAGGGIEAPDLQALAAALPAHGIEIILVEQPWRVAGKRIASPPATLDSAWCAVLDELRGRAAADRRRSGDVPLLVGGRSAGARVACRTGRAAGAVGIVALAFPLHPPGKPEKSRAGELTGTGVPTLVVQGAADPFGTAAQFPVLPGSHRIVALPAGNHEFAVRKNQPPVLDALAEAVADWIEPVLEDSSANMF